MSPLSIRSMCCDLFERLPINDRTYAVPHANVF